MGVCAGFLGKTNTICGRQSRCVGDGGQNSNLNISLLFLGALLRMVWDACCDAIFGRVNVCRST